MEGMWPVWYVAGGGAWIHHRRQTKGEQNARQDTRTVSPKTLWQACVPDTIGSQRTWLIMACCGWDVGVEPGGIPCCCEGGCCMWG